MEMVDFSLKLFIRQSVLTNKNLDLPFWFLFTSNSHKKLCHRIVEKQFVMTVFWNYFDVIIATWLFQTVFGSFQFHNDLFVEFNNLSGNFDNYDRFFVIEYTLFQNTFLGLSQINLRQQSQIITVQTNVFT